MFLLPHHCGWPDCNKPLIGDLSVCGHCTRNLCSEHIEQPHHQCMILEHARETTRKSKQAFVWSGVHRHRRKLNRQWTPLIPILHQLDFAQQAAECRPGHTCTVTLPSSFKEVRKLGLHSMMNSLFPITFDDGVKWLVRIRQRKPWSPTCEVQRLIDESEVATMQILKSAGLPVPGAWMPRQAKAGAEEWGVFYFFVEFCEGKQFRAFSSPIAPAHATHQEVEQIIFEYAKFQAKLSELKFDAIGCILPSTHGSGTHTIGPYPGFSQPDPPRLLGPYKTQRERYCEQIDVILACIAKGELFEGRLLFAALGYTHARRIVCEQAVLGECDTSFYVKHIDDKGDIFFMSDAGLEGIIDWEWAFTTTAAEAFSSPRFCRGSDSYRGGSNELSPEEHLLVAAYENLGRGDLANLLRNGRLYNRLGDLLSGFIRVATLNGLSLAAGFCTPHELPTNQDDWVAWALNEYGGVDVVKQLKGDRYRI